MPPLTLQQAFELALQHHQAGRLPQAEQLYRQILAHQPNHAESLHMLGVLAHQAGRNDMAVDLIRQALGLNPDYPEAHCNLGLILENQGQLDEAIAACRQALVLDPNYAEAYNNLAAALQGKGQSDDAIVACRQALTLNPRYPDAYNNLGTALSDRGHLDEAIVAYRQALALKPGFPEAHSNLGNALSDRGQLEDAIGAYRQAIVLNPNYPKAHNNLANSLKDQGQLDQAITAYRQAITLRPSYTDAHSNLVYALHFHPAWNAQAIYQELCRWNLQHAAPIRPFIQPHHNDRAPDRRLKIGYVSPDFRDHCQSFFTVPLFSQHNHKDFEIICYSTVTRPDVMTARLRGYSDHWRSLVGLSGEQAAQLIRDDRIDILVDLTLHMAHSHLLVFAYKPAPVQVTWLGYPGSTGLSTIDYRLSDPYLDPPGMDESVYSEQTMRLPESFWCYDPLECGDMPVSALPALANGFITFGSLNSFGKINDAVLRLWAQVLRAVPASRLLLLAPEGRSRQETLKLFEQEDVAPQRIEFVARQPRRRYLELYHRIDLGLDTFPYNGHTTSLDSLWMGVPVVSLYGSTAVSRAGLSQCSNLRMKDLVTADREQYVQIALDLARDLPRLAQLRTTLRPRMQQSPLMDAPRFTRHLEAAYRQMWQKWCAEAPPL